jgi:excisionase family DNA binding protein
MRPYEPFVKPSCPLWLFHICSAFSDRGRCSRQWPQPMAKPDFGQIARNLTELADCPRTAPLNVGVGNMQSRKANPAAEPIEFPARSTHSDLGLNAQSPPNLGSDERLLTPQEVADRLGVSQRWVRDHATRRWPRITAVKLGSLLRFRWRDVQDFLAHNTLQGSSKKQVGGV